MEELQNSRRPRWRFTTEQKLFLLRQWQEGTPLAELCRENCPVTFWLRTRLRCHLPETLRPKAFCDVAA
jgi:hypothetical protein